MAGVVAPAALGFVPILTTALLTETMSNNAAAPMRALAVALIPVFWPR